jgi:hypothetical protein
MNTTVNLDGSMTLPELLKKMATIPDDEVIGNLPHAHTLPERKVQKSEA